MNKQLYSCTTKIVYSHDNKLDAKPQWITSQPQWKASNRTILQLFEDHLTYGDLTIRYCEIDNAHLGSIRSPILRIPEFILTIFTSDQKTYTFGLDGPEFWKNELPFPVERTETQLPISWIHVGIRIALIVVTITLVIWLWFN